MTTAPGDNARLETTMQACLEGARTGSSDPVRPIFHETATICGYVGSFDLMPRIIRSRPITPGNQ